MSAHSQESTTQTISVPAIRIACLPVELDSTDSIASFIHYGAGFGPVSAVYINKSRAPNGVEFRGATVILKNWHSEDSMFKVGLAEAGSQGIKCACETEGWNFTFPNGKPMTHLKFIADSTTAPQLPPYSPELKLGPDDWKSIYIPVLPTDLAFDGDGVDLNELIENHLKLGRVKRIDITKRKLGESEKDTYAAYVHFEYWTDNQETLRVRKFIDKTGEFQCRGFYDGFRMKRFDHNRFLAFKVNHKPIPDADGSLNIHQLTAANKGLEKENVDLRAEMVAMHTDMVTKQTEIGVLRDEISRLHRALTAQYCETIRTIVEEDEA